MGSWISIYLEYLYTSLTVFFCVLEPTYTETYIGNSYCNSSQFCFSKGYSQCYLLGISCFIRLKQLFHTLETVVSYA